MTKARSTKTFVHVESEHALYPVEEMEIAEEVGPELIVDESYIIDDDVSSRRHLFRQIALDDAPEDRDSTNILREMAMDLDELRGLSQTMASIRKACSEGVDWRSSPPTDSDFLDDCAKPPQMPGFLDQAAELTAKHGAYETREKDVDFKDVMVELRVESLLKMPFQAAQQECQGLRQYIYGDLELEQDFEEHWHSQAPEELRQVLRELLQAEISEVENGDAEGHFGIQVPHGAGAPIRSRL